MTGVPIGNSVSVRQNRRLNYNPLQCSRSESSKVPNPKGGSNVMSRTKRNLANIVLLFASMALAAGEQEDKKSTVKKELKKLEGTWEVVSVESNGRKEAEG